MKKCPSCGYPNPEGRATCYKCSTDLPQMQATPQQPVRLGAGRLKPLRYHPSVFEEIQRILAPGENLLAVCDFRTVRTKQGVTAAVTDRYVRFFGFRHDSGTPRIVSNSAIDLNSITGVASSRGAQFLGSPYIRVTIWWQNATEVIDTSYIDGETFVTQLSRAVAERRTNVAESVEAPTGVNTPLQTNVPTPPRTPAPTARSQPSQTHAVEGLFSLLFLIFLLYTVWSLWRIDVPAIEVTGPAAQYVELSDWSRHGSELSCRIRLVGRGPNLVIWCREYDSNGVKLNDSGLDYPSLATNQEGVAKTIIGSNGSPAKVVIEVEEAAFP